MKESKYIELMLREADGTISARQKRQLDRCLAADPAMAELHRRVLHGGQMLKELELPEPSTDLPDAIMAQIRTLPAYRGAAPARPAVLQWLLSREPGRLIPVRLATVAAVMAAAIVLVVRFATGPSIGETSHLSATMSADSAGQDLGGASCAVRFDGVTGHLEAAREGTNIVLAATLTADRSVPMEITVLLSQPSPSGGDEKTVGEGTPQGKTTALSHPGDGSRVLTQLEAPVGFSSATIIVRLDTAPAPGAEYRLYIAPTP